MCCRTYYLRPPSPVTRSFLVCYLSPLFDRLLSSFSLSRLVTTLLHTDDLSPSLFLFLSRSLSPHLLLPFLRYFLLPLVSPLSRLLEPAQEDRCLLRVGRVMPATATNRCPICVLGLYRYSTLDFPMCLAYSSLFPSIQSFPLVLGFRSSTFIRSGCCFYFIGLLIWISF